MNKDEFAAQLDDAYGQLYDLVYLRTHSLLDILVPDTSLALKERAWELHHLLLNMISELEPDPPMPVRSRPWRRHQLMVLRYRRGLHPEAVAEQLSIGLRHYYREHQTAMNALAEILWDRYKTGSTDASAQSLPERDRQAALSEMELLRLEAGRLAQAGRYARLGEVMDGALALLADELRRRAVRVQVALPSALPGISVNQSLLRQIVLQVLGYLVERAEGIAIRVVAQVEQAQVRVTMQAEPIHGVPPEPTHVEQLRALQEMAGASGIQAEPILQESVIVGFRLNLPIAEDAVLVIDDNADTLQLFRLYLEAHHYPVVAAQSAEAGLELARSLKPYAIFLDLMMPDRDGWDLLQTLLTHPDTESIPIIVCTVLKQRELALSLGATAFLTKPFTERDLLGALNALHET